MTRPASCTTPKQATDTDRVQLMRSQIHLDQVADWLSQDE